MLEKKSASLLLDINCVDGGGGGGGGKRNGGERSQVRAFEKKLASTLGTEVNSWFGKGTTALRIGKG